MGPSTGGGAGMSTQHNRGAVGIVPAAGRGTRLGRLPFCKELYPLGRKSDADGNPTEGWRVVCDHVIEQMAHAGVDRVFIVLGRGKSAIMEYFGGGGRLGLHIAYLLQEELRGMPFAIDLAHSWLRDETVLFGMPD